MSMVSSVALDVINVRQVDIVWFYVAALNY